MTEVSLAGDLSVGDGISGHLRMAGSVSEAPRMSPQPDTSACGQ